MRLLACAAILVLATGCGTAVSEPSPSSVPPPATTLSPTDLAYVELVIPQNESALAALALARKGSDAALVKLADQAEPVYRAELDRLNALVVEAGRQDIKQHEGHDMPGMITAAELAGGGDLGSLLRTQFEESRTVARAELSSGTAKPVLELGADVERTRTEFLALLGTP